MNGGTMGGTEQEYYTEILWLILYDKGCRFSFIRYVGLKTGSKNEMRN